MLLYGQSPAAWQLLVPLGAASGRCSPSAAASGVVVAAGHDHNALERMATRAIWLADGHVVEDGTFAEVIPAYRAAPTG